MLVENKIKNTFYIFMMIMVLGFFLLTVSLATKNSQKELPKITLISVSTFSEWDKDVWIVDYAINGIVQSVRIPITQSPQNYLDYLTKIGDLTE